MKKPEHQNRRLRPEYRREDFPAMERGKYAERCREASNVVVLSPDVQKFFPNAEAVNNALRALIEADKQTP